MELANEIILGGYFRTLHRGLSQLIHKQFNLFCFCLDCKHCELPCTSEAYLPSTLQHPLPCGL